MQNTKNLLIIGVGSIGARHLRCFLQTGRVRTSICEPNESLRTRIAGEYDVAHAYADFESAMADRYDAAVVATPAQHHIPQAIALVEAGVHVLIEKPLSTNADGVVALQEAVRRRGVVAAVAYVLRANPILQAMREAIASGRFGKPVEVVAVSGQNFPTYRPAYRDTYYCNRNSGGGAIQDALTHAINAGEWLVGPIDRLAADAAHQVLEGVTVEDTVHVLARHGSVLGSYSLNQHQAPNELTITVVCERGTARFEGHRNRWRWMIQPDEPWHDEPYEPLPRDAMFIRQAECFLDAVENRFAPLCSLEEGIQTLRANLAMLASADQMAWQSTTGFAE